VAFIGSASPRTTTFTDVVDDGSRRGVIEPVIMNGISEWKGNKNQKGK